MDNLNLQHNLNPENKPVVETGNFSVAEREIQEKREVAKEKFEQNKVEQDLKNETQFIQPKSKSDVGAPGIDISRSPLHQNIEAVLEENLSDLYFSMNPQQQAAFKNKGEKITQEIVKLIETGKGTFKKIFKLIFSWLKFIPGVNKFFIEQESKIKADRILNIKS